MRVLSIRQPYATLIVRGIKRFELRTWSTPYRGEIAIHASSIVTRSELDRLREYDLFRDALELAEIDDPRALPRRAVVGTAIISDISSARELKVRRELLEIDYVMCGNDVDHEDQLWRLERPTELRTPVPTNGKLNLWTLPDREAARVKRATRVPPMISSAVWQKAFRSARRS